MTTINLTMPAWAFDFVPPSERPALHHAAALWADESPRLGSRLCTGILTLNHWTEMYLRVLADLSNHYRLPVTTALKNHAWAVVASLRSCQL